MKTEVAVLTKTAFMLCFVLLSQLARVERVEAAVVGPDVATAYAANSFQAQNLQRVAGDVAKATAGQGQMTRRPAGMHFKPAEIFAEASNGATEYDDTHHMGEVSRPGIEKAPSNQGWQWRYAVPRLPQNFESKHAIAAMAGFRGVRMRMYNMYNPASGPMAELIGAKRMTMRMTIQMVDSTKAISGERLDWIPPSSRTGGDPRAGTKLTSCYQVTA